MEIFKAQLSSTQCSVFAHATICINLITIDSYHCIESSILLKSEHAQRRKTCQNSNAYVLGIRGKYLILEVESVALETMATF